MQDEDGPEPFGRAYRLLRADLASGQLKPHVQIKVGPIAANLKISPTPVREALSRLAGERLVVDRRHLGYFAAGLNERTLAELYAIQSTLLIGGLGRIGSRSKRGREHAQAVRTADIQSLSAPLSTAVVTDMIASMSGNDELRAMNAWVNARLDPVRSHEAALIPTSVRDSLEAAARSGAAKSIAAALRRYSASCRRSGPELAELLTSRGVRI